MLAGPGAISTVILLQSRAVDVAQHVSLYLCVVAVSFGSYLIFRVSARGAQWFSPIAMKVTTRIMGLLLAAVAVQFMINGLKAVRADWLQP
jgi:multiple antibiotic resistance protein